MPIVRKKIPKLLSFIYQKNLISMAVPNMQNYMDYKVKGF